MIEIEKTVEWSGYSLFSGVHAEKPVSLNGLGDPDDLRGGNIITALFGDCVFEDEVNISTSQILFYGVHNNEQTEMSFSFFSCKGYIADIDITSLEYDDDTGHVGGAYIRDSKSKAIVLGKGTYHITRCEAYEVWGFKDGVYRVEYSESKNIRVEKSFFYSFSCSCENTFSISDSLWVSYFDEFPNEHKFELFSSFVYVSDYEKPFKKIKFDPDTYIESLRVTFSDFTVNGILHTYSCEFEESCEISGVFVADKPKIACDVSLDSKKSSVMSRIIAENVICVLAQKFFRAFGNDAILVFADKSDPIVFPDWEPNTRTVVCELTS